MAVQYQVNTTNTQGVIKKLIQEYTEDDLYIAIPATVVGVSDYEELQVVNVKPSIDLIFTEYNDHVVKSNVIKKVFVKLPAAGGFSVTWPILVGDLVTLHWSHRDLGDFLDGSGDDIEQSKHDVANIEDCWVSVGFGTRKNNQSPSATDLVLKNENLTVTITPEGNIDVETLGTSTVKSSLHKVDTDQLVTGNQTVGGATAIQGTLDVVGNTSILGNTAVTGITTLTGATTALGNLDFATLSNAGVVGVSGVFTSESGSITIQNGIITAIA